MISQYQTTNQGQVTRSQLVKCFDANEDLSREELSQRSGLTYEQVRRQTKNLCIEGVISSSISTNGKRVYRLRTSFIQKIGVSTVCLLIAWSVPVGTKFVKSKTYVPAQVAIECS